MTPTKKPPQLVPGPKKHLSSTAGPWELPTGDLQDPFLVSVHILANPREAKTFQSAADRLLSLLHPQLTLFRVSERAERPQRRTPCHLDLQLSCRPCLCVNLFLREDYRREERHEQQLRRPPWHYHHTEQVKGPSFSPAMQDFYQLAPGTPLWALRKVHYGKEIVRLTLHCRYETYIEQVRLYRLLLRRPLAQRNQLCSSCVVYSNHHMEIQLSFKRSPPGQVYTPVECTLMEIRVRNMDGLIPVLPHSCRPISDVRWQTKDHDGNRILLQVQGSSKRSGKTIPFTSPSGMFSLAPSNAYVPDVHPKHGSQSTTCSHTRNLLEQSSQPTPCRQNDIESVQCSQGIVRAGWADIHSRSFKSTATEALHSESARPSTFRPCSSFSLTTSRFRINVDTLVGAEETDVDTGQAVSRSVDLSVVSAYMLPQREINSQTPSEHRPLDSVSSPLKPSNKIKLLPTSVRVLQASSKRNRGARQSHGSAGIQGITVEDKREFFI